MDCMLNIHFLKWRYCLFDREAVAPRHFVECSRGSYRQVGRVMHSCWQVDWTLFSLAADGSSLRWAETVHHRSSPAAVTVYRGVGPSGLCSNVFSIMPFFMLNFFTYYSVTLTHYSLQIYVMSIQFNYLRWLCRNVREHSLRDDCWNGENYVCKIKNTPCRCLDHAYADTSYNMYV